MNRFDRITAILIQLQARRVVRGQDLAERFGVSLRTVYRDLRTLEAAGVPLSGEAGQGYSLAEGYRLPPVMFSREEATALITAEKLAGQLTDTATARLGQAAMDKLRAVLRRPDRDYLEALSPRITVRQPPGQEHPRPGGSWQQQLLAGIAAQQVMSLEYRAGFEGDVSQRDIEPLSLYYGQHWHLVAFCRLRQAYRDFRLDRIVGLRGRDEHFCPRPDLSVYWAERARRNQQHTVVLRFTAEALPLLQEAKHYYGWAHETRTADGGREMTFLVGCLHYLARWLLLFAGQVRIVAPAALHEAVAELARAAHAHFASAAPVEAGK